MTNAKKNLPYPLRVITHIARLPKYISYFEQRDSTLSEQIDVLSRAKDQLASDNEKLQSDVAYAKTKSSSIDKIDNKLLDLQQKMFSAPAHDAHPQKRQEVVNATVSDNHDYDNFYKKFEDKFRGTEAQIKERVSGHLPLFESLPNSLKQKVIVDIGCGRGEFLSVLKENGFRSVGIDMNQEMVERAIKLKHKAIQTDAQSYLKQQKTGSLAAVTGFHIVEHIPFEALMSIFAECYRTVARGGFVLFETPNPRSLFVGANTFYLDPSHQRPVPSELLSFMLEYSGFDTEVVPLHRLRAEAKIDDDNLRETFETVFGFADYAVIGRKI